MQCETGQNWHLPAALRVAQAGLANAWPAFGGWWAVALLPPKASVACSTGSERARADGNGGVHQNRIGAQVRYIPAEL